MKSCPWCWRQTVSEKQEWIFNICPYISVLPAPLSFKLALLCTRHKATWLRLALFEYVSGIFRSFAREDAGSVASGLWRWLVSVSSITGASFKLMHNRASQSTSSLIVTSLLPVRGGEWEPKKERETDREVKVTSLFSSYLHLRCYGLALRNRATMDGRVKGLLWALVSDFNCPLCQMGDNKQFEALSCLRPFSCRCRLLGGEATDRTLKPDASVTEVNLCCDGVANIMASFIDTDCSDTSKSGPINLQACVWRDGRLWGHSGVAIRQQMFVWPPLQALGRSGNKRCCCSVKGTERWCCDRIVYSVSNVTWAGYCLNMFYTGANMILKLQPQAYSLLLKTCVFENRSQIHSDASLLVTPS